MIEVIYKEEKQGAKGNEGMFSIPRNIRQIGLASEDYRIYMEDYVYTFLVRLAGTDTSGENEKGHLAVLTGDSKWHSGVTYVFIRGALTVDKSEAAADHIDFSEKVWSKIQDEQELYFPGQEIMGWFFAQQELQLDITEVFKRVHLKHFGGGEKVLMLMDPAEKEDAFFRYENSFLVRQSGYYLFYEKNPLMQNYMLDKNQEIPAGHAEEVPDEAVAAFRKIIKSKKRTKREEKEETSEQTGELEQEERPSVFSYAATACLAIAVLAVGVNFYRNYQEGYYLERQIKTASAPMKEEATITVAATPTPVLKKENQFRPAVKPEQSIDGRETSSSNNTGTKKEKSLQTNPKETDSTQNRQENINQQTEGSGRIPAEPAREEADLRKGKRKQKAEAENKVQNEEPQSSQENGQAVSSSAAHSSYVIRPGDTLYQISIEKYGSMDAISEICRLNGLKEEEIIYPGQIIVLP